MLFLIIEACGCPHAKRPDTARLLDSKGISPLVDTMHLYRKIDESTHVSGRT